MTTIEHALLGATGALAAGLHRRSWQIVAMAGSVAVLPDWDGLSILFGAAAFDHMHRAAGHSLLVATAVAVAAAMAEHRLQCLARVAALLGRHIEGIPQPLPPADSAALSAREGVGFWIVVAVLATWSHLLADLLFSGHARLSDWGLKLLWPFSHTTYVLPAVRWGDPLPTVILLAGMFAMLRWRARTQALAALTLLTLVGYIALRGLLVPG